MASLRLVNPGLLTVVKQESPPSIDPEAASTEEQALPSFSSEVVKDIYRAIDTRDRTSRAEARWRLPNDQVITAIMKAVDLKFQEPIPPSSVALLLSTWIVAHTLRVTEDQSLAKFADPLGLKETAFEVMLGEHFGLVLVEGKPVGLVMTPVAMAQYTPGSPVAPKDKVLIHHLDALCPDYDLDSTVLPFLMRVKPNSWPDRAKAIDAIKQALVAALFAASKR